MEPVLFQIPFGDTPIPVHAFGVAMGAAILAGWYLVVGPADPRLRRRTRARAFVAMLAGTMVGALLGRLFGGGGMALGVLGALAFLRFVGSPKVLGPHAGVLLGIATVAWGVGVWLDGAVFGFPLDSGLGQLARYERWPDGTGAPALFTQIGAGWLPVDATRSLPTHPVGLYYAALGVALAIYGWVGRRREETLWVAIGVLGVARALLDGLRHDLTPVALAAERSLACALVLASIVGVWVWLVRPAERDQSTT